MEPTIVLILAGAGAAIVLVLAMKFGRRIALFVLALAVLAVVVVGALALLTQGAANYQTARAATVAATGQTVGTMVIGALVVLVLILATVIEYLAVRLWLAERRVQGKALPWQERGPRMARGRRQEVLSSAQPVGRVMYIVQDEDTGVAIEDWQDWGWE